jgi:hypothetical protein
MVRLVTNTWGPRKAEHQKLVNEKLKGLNKFVKENNINPKKVFTGNVDRVLTLDGYTHCAFVAGLNDAVVLQEVGTWENIYDSRNEGK